MGADGAERMAVAQRPREVKGEGEREGGRERMEVEEKKEKERESGWQERKTSAGNEWIHPYYIK